MITRQNYCKRCRQYFYYHSELYQGRTRELCDGCRSQWARERARERKRKQRGKNAQTGRDGSAVSGGGRAERDSALQIPEGWKLRKNRDGSVTISSEAAKIIERMGRSLGNHR